MHSALDPNSPQARAIAHLWWWMLGAGGVIWLGVSALAIYTAMRGRGLRAADDLAHVTEPVHRRVERIVGGGIFATLLVLSGFLIFDFSVGRLLAQHPEHALTIDVVGHQWWWEVHYENPDPSKSVGTANEIHVPTGEMIQFKLRSTDVIHSFWAPNLSGKRDLIPGYTSTLWFKADTAGVYRGQCAEFCGLQHAQMAFYIVAQSPVAFAAWLAAGASDPTPPTDSTLLYGQRIFMASGCALCHAIGGTQAFATVGPDLTHLKSRATIAAGALSNTRANLAGWIANPSALKPGVRMPSIPLTGPQLQALVSYLETLK
ncbi:MAG TPA: cytochrome c oxidase subunit II [Gemmatimonadaceae bacterium]|jgi:cytochrome c oxidase subunit 2|nr:cytochrome c oxidase subunit II [Gemmatimonadaceae bacterium]